MARVEFRGTPPWLDVVAARLVQPASITPDPRVAQYFPVTVNTSLTVHAVSTAPKGARLTLEIANGKTSGSITVTFDSAYKLGTYSPPAAQKRNTIAFLSPDGITWVQIGAQSPNFSI